jgi:hypothetical protein
VHNIHQQARDRQQAILSAAEQRQDMRQVARVSRAARRAERAERQLSRSWHEAVQRRAELHQIAADAWR